MFARLKSLFRRGPAIGDPYEQFVAAFIDECSRQGLKPTHYDHGERCFTIAGVAGGDVTAFLDNVFRAWVSSDDRSRAEKLGRFVRSVRHRALATATDLSQPAAGLLPGVRSRALLSALSIESRTRGTPPGGDGDDIAWRPFCGELATCVLRDLRDSMQLIKRSELEAVKLSFDQAMTGAMRNLRTGTVPSFEPVPTAAGLFYCGSLEDYQSSLLLMTPGEDFAFPALDGDPVALVPARNRLFVTGSRNQPALRALLGLAGTAAQQEAHFCSSGLWIWRDDAWGEYSFPAGTDEAVRQRQIATAQLASDYGRQKDLLDRLHRTQNKDVYVSNFTVWQTGDDPRSQFSITTFASGALGTLLPVADRLAFGDQIVDPETGMARQIRESVEVAWSDAMAVAGPLFEPLPDLYPPRYRTLGFPDADVWSELRTRAVTRRTS